MCDYDNICFITYNIGGSKLTSNILEKILNDTDKDNVIINFQECTRNTKTDLEKITNDIGSLKLNYVSSTKGETNFSNFGLITAYFTKNIILGGEKKSAYNINFNDLKTKDSVFNTNYKNGIPILYSGTKGASINRIELIDTTYRNKYIDVVNIHLPFGEINFDQYKTYFTDLANALIERSSYANLTVVMGDLNSRSTALLKYDEGTLTLKNHFTDYITDKEVITKKSKIINNEGTPIGPEITKQEMNTYQSLLNNLLPNNLETISLGGKLVSSKFKKNKNKYMTTRKKHYSNKKNLEK